MASPCIALLFCERDDVSVLVVLFLESEEDVVIEREGFQAALETDFEPG